MSDTHAITTHDAQLVEHQLMQILESPCTTNAEIS